MTDRPQLKPCPFCGGEAGYWGDPSAPRWGVECHRCVCDLGGEYPSKESAAASWNTRTPDDAEILKVARKVLCAAVKETGRHYFEHGKNREGKEWLDCLACVAYINLDMYSAALHEDDAALLSIAKGGE